MPHLMTNAQLLWRQAPPLAYGQVVEFNATSILLSIVNLLSILPTAWLAACLTAGLGMFIDLKIIEGQILAACDAALQAPGQQFSGLLGRV